MRHLDFRKWIVALLTVALATANVGGVAIANISESESESEGGEEIEVALAGKIRRDFSAQRARQPEIKRVAKVVTDMALRCSQNQDSAAHRRATCPRRIPPADDDGSHDALT